MRLGIFSTSSRCSLVNAPGFHIRRLACQGCTHCNCSGNLLGSAAAVNASLPRIADAWCWPCPSRGVPLKRRMITSGRKRRITQTTSLRIFSRPHFSKRFLRSLGEAEVDRAREELFGAVDPAGSQQLLRADHAQRIALLGANQILAAFAARERQDSRSALSGRAPDKPAAPCSRRRDAPRSSGRCRSRSAGRAPGELAPIRTARAARTRRRKTRRPLRTARMMCAHEVPKQYDTGRGRRYGVGRIQS